ncbi:hypothetical protein [Streptomyces sviceus]|uniref:hypothetical protein n=1 Tax=Streptomyces sviceus TaxID=285530 RepID=UPI00331BB0C1
MRKSPSPTKPLIRPPVRIGSLNTARLIAELRVLHEEAEDPDVARMPADDELYQALLHLEAHAGALKKEDARREAALVRVKLWEYIREKADIHQARAVETARAAGVEWTDLAPALAVKSSTAAYNKATRLRAAALLDLSPDGVRAVPVRRTPEAVLTAERRAAQRAEEERRAQEQAARRHSLIAPVAQRLLDHREGLDDDEDVIYWLEQIGAVLPDCHTPTQLVGLETYLEAAVRALKTVERTTSRPAAVTAEARLAYAAAAQLVAR